jgi:predicted alpha/beta hydrolase family esterase
MYIKIVIVPGNGCINVRDSNWYGYAESLIAGAGGIVGEVILRNMPDPAHARSQFWIPFLLNECGVDENTIIIGHSSGAEACMRLLEEHKLLGCVLVSACYTDLGLPSEAISGYYNKEWMWSAIKENAGDFGIIQFHSKDDPFIPMCEAEHVAEMLDSDFHVYDNRSHFFNDSDFDEIWGVILKKLEKL